MPKRKFPRPRREKKSTIKAKLIFMPLPTMSRELKKFSVVFVSGCLKYRCRRREKDCRSSLLFLSTSALFRATHAVHAGHFSCSAKAWWVCWPAYNPSIANIPSLQLFHVSKPKWYTSSSSGIFSARFLQQETWYTTASVLTFLSPHGKKGSCWNLWSHRCVCLHFSV